MAIRNEVKDMLRANVDLIESRSRLKPNPEWALSAAKIAQAAVGRRSSKTAGQQRRGRRESNRKSLSFSSEAFAGVRIGYRHQKEAQPEGQHDDIQMGCSLSRLFPGATVARSGKEDCDGSRTVNVVAYMFSRWALAQRYRKVIGVRKC